MKTKDIITLARAQYATDDLQIDSNPIVSKGEDGAWVAAWVHVAGVEDDEGGRIAALEADSRRLAALMAILTPMLEAAHGMTEGLKYHDDLAWLSGTAPDGEIYTVATLALDSNADQRCYNARRNGAGIALIINSLPALARVLKDIP